MIRFAHLGALYMREAEALERLRLLGFLAKAAPLPASIRRLRCLDEAGSVMFAARRADYLEFLRYRVEQDSTPARPGAIGPGPTPSGPRAKLGTFAFNCGGPVRLL